MTRPRGASRGRVKGSKNRATLAKEAALAAEEAARAASRKGGRLREAIDRAFTTEEMVEMLRRLPPGEVAKVIASQEPRRKEEEQRSTFNLVIGGVSPRCLGCGKTRQYPPCSCGFVEKEPTPGPAPQDAPGGPISPPPTPGADHSGAPKAYIPDEGAIKRLREAREVGLGEYQGEDWPDFDFEKEV
jgi:hypothetical protein